MRKSQWHQLVSGHNPLFFFQGTEWFTTAVNLSSRSTFVSILLALFVKAFILATACSSTSMFLQSTPTHSLQCAQFISRNILLSAKTEGGVFTLRLALFTYFTLPNSGLAGPDILASSANRLDCYIWNRFMVPSLYDAHLFWVSLFEYFQRESGGGP